MATEKHSGAARAGISPEGANKPINMASFAAGVIAAREVLAKVAVRAGKPNGGLDAAGWLLRNALQARITTTREALSDAEYGFVLGLTEFIVDALAQPSAGVCHD